MVPKVTNSDEDTRQRQWSTKDTHAIKDRTEPGSKIPVNQSAPSAALLRQTTPVHRLANRTPTVRCRKRRGELAETPADDVSNAVKTPADAERWSPLGHRTTLDARPLRAPPTQGVRPHDP